MWNVDHELYVGHFQSARDAGKAYDRAAIRWVLPSDTVLLVHAHASVRTASGWKVLVPYRIKGPECANMDGLNFPFTAYLEELPSLMDQSVDTVLADIRNSGVHVNPLDPDKPLR